MPRSRIRLTAYGPALVLRAPDGEATHLQARPAGPVRIDWQQPRKANRPQDQTAPSPVFRGSLGQTVRVGRVGPGGEYAGVHLGAKLHTKRRGEYYVGVSAGRKIATPFSPH